MGGRGVKVDSFAAMMRHELNQNEWKGDPQNYPLEHHLRELPYHVTKLKQAVLADDLVRVIEHAADVGNGAYFIALVTGALEPKVLKARCDEEGVVHLSQWRRWYAIARHPSVWLDKVKMRVRYPK